MRNIILIAACVILAGCSTPYVAGAGVGIAYREGKAKMSPQHKKSMKLAYEALKIIVADKNAKSTPDALISVAKKVAVAKGYDPAVIAVAESVIREVYRKISARYDLKSGDAKVVLRDFKLGVEAVLRRDNFNHE